LTAIENTFDEHCVGGHHERNRRSPFKSDGSQARQDVVTSGAAQGNVLSPSQKATIRLT